MSTQDIKISGEGSYDDWSLYVIGYKYEPDEDYKKRLDNWEIREKEIIKERIERIKKQMERQKKELEKIDIIEKKVQKDQKKELNQENFQKTKLIVEDIINIYI